MSHLPQDSQYSDYEMLIALRIREEMASERARELEVKLFREVGRLSA